MVKTGSTTHDTNLDYIAILGPTASGKTNLALQFAKIRPIEVISVDSVSIYQGLDIASAKPTNKERGDVIHHLIDVCSLEDIYTVGQFVADVSRLIVEINGRGAMPVICGGTMMYMHAFLNGYQHTPDVCSEVIKQINMIVETKGQTGLYELLCSEDPMMAKRIHPNDQQRTHRALAVMRSTGQSLCAYWQPSPSKLKGHHFLLKVDDRAQHRGRLIERVGIMFEHGVVDECVGIMQKYPELITVHPALRSIGYKEVIAGIRERKDMAVVRDEIVLASAKFVKRQMTWLNRWAYSTTTTLSVTKYSQNMKKCVDVMVERLE